MSATILFQELEDMLLSEKNEMNAVPMKAYMKGHFEYLGIRGPTSKELFKEFWKRNKEDLKLHWKALAHLCWKADYREFKYMAMKLIGKFEKQLVPEDLPDIEHFLTTDSWWDTVDFLASHAVGQILKKDEDFMFETADRYMKSNDMWLNRTAIIFQLFYKKETYQDLLFAMIDETKGRKEFFINKACGWALRQYSRVNPQDVSEFIESRGSQLSNLTIKEGSKFI